MSRAGPAGSDAGEPLPPDFDAIYCGDFSRPGLAAFELAAEADASAAAGFRIALAHTPVGPAAGPVIAPDIQGCVRRFHATPVDPALPVSAAAIILRDQRALSPLLAGAGGLSAPKIVVVCDRLPEVQPATAGLPVSWAPTGSAIRRAFAQRYPDLPLEPEDWAPSLAKLPAAEDGPLGHRLRVGVIAGPDAASWPRARDELAAILPGDGSIDVRILGSLPPTLMPPPDRWRLLDPGRISVRRFLASLDALAWFPSGAHAEPPAMAIRSMLAAGRPVLLARRLEPAFGKGPVYCDPAEVGPTLRAFAADPVARRMVRRAAQRAVKPAPPAPARLLSAPMHLGLGPASRHPKRVALFLASNGTGLGHVARLLAIARRAVDYEPVFVTMGPAARIAGSFGFTAEYLPSHSTLDVDVGEWDSWFQAELEQKLDIYGASLIVYDGNAPTDGLVRAAGGRDAGLVWVRNGMIGRARMPLIGNAGYCTMVIEPRDLAGGLDFGETAQRADEAVAVDPILLFEPEELLPRAEAAAALGLDPGKPAILIQLGSGSNRDILGIIDRVVRALAAAPDVQVCVGGWSNAAPLPDLWQRVQPLRGFPFTRYLRAFDFAISAAGYSSFHETIGYAVPTIFVPNRHASMDDQVARAAFAEGEGMALQLDDRRPDDVQAMVKTLLAEPARAFLAENCRKAAFRGGAEDAARLIGEAIG